MRRIYRKEESRLFHCDLYSPVGMGKENKERLPQVVCFRPGNETGGLDLEERKEGENLIFSCFDGRLAWLEGS